MERFYRTFKEQVVHGRIHQTIEEFEAAVATFIRNYNESWILEKLGYLSPYEAQQNWKNAQEV